MMKEWNGLGHALPEGESRALTQWMGLEAHPLRQGSRLSLGQCVPKTIPFFHHHPRSEGSVVNNGPQSEGVILIHPAYANEKRLRLTKPLRISDEKLMTRSKNCLLYTSDAADDP